MQLSSIFERFVYPLGLPAAFLTGAFVVTMALGMLPPSYLGLLKGAPYIVGSLGGFFCWRFRRANAMFALFILIVGHWLVTSYIPGDLGANQYGQHAYAIFCFLAPLNLLIFGLIGDRGLFTSMGILQIVFILAQLLVAILFITGGTNILDPRLAQWLRLRADDFVYLRLISSQYDLWTNIPQIALFAFAISLLGLYARLCVTMAPMDGAFLGAGLGLGIGLHFVQSPHITSVFSSASSLLFMAAALQESYSMAFLDELTGIPGRRALMTDFSRVGNKYVVAMVDVDHFKKFNDTYGHDVGDQVLRMIAAHLQAVPGGGRAYRYGGEEFTIIFPGKRLEEAVPHLDEARERIASAAFTIRGKNRPPKKATQDKTGKQSKGGAQDKTREKSKTKDTVQVTVSMGAAERPDAKARPHEVIKAADEALYKAKKNGRNQVMT